MITFALNPLAVAFFLTGSIKSQQAVSDHVEYLRIFMRCWLFELPETFQVTVLRKTVTCSADPRAKSQHRQISTHRIRQNVGFLPGDFQKSQHRTHMNRPAPLQAAPANRKKNSTSPRLDMVSGMCRPRSLPLQGRSCILCQIIWP